MRKSGALSKCALMLAGACLPVAWLGLPAGDARAVEGQAATQSQEAASAPAPDVNKSLNDIATNFCEKCHNTTDWAGSLAMDSMDLGHTDQDPQV